MAIIEDCTISPLSAHTGAEVCGIDLTRPIDAELRELLNCTFIARSVLVFREQHLSPPELLEAVQMFGEIFPQHNSRFSLPECPLIHYISNQDFYPDGKRYIPGEGYHTDHSNAAEPPKRRCSTRCSYRIAAVTRNSSTCIAPMKICPMRQRGGSTD